MYVATDISKAYGPASALENVTVRLQEGEIHSLLGMNGAGKSTLVKILAGVIRADSGELTLGGAPIDLRSAVDARAAGISLVPQHLSLFRELDILSNLFLGSELTSGPFVARARQHAIALQVLKRVGLDRSPQELVATLPIGEQQLVGIARALLETPRVLILDEPTSALPVTDRVRLFAILRKLRADGVAVVLVTHYLDEAFELSDRITVLRDRKVVMEGRAVSKSTFDELIDAVTGPLRSLESAQEGTSIRQPGHFADIDRVEVADVSVRGVLNHVSLTAGPGEIVGVAGLIGSGASELLDVIVGAIRPDSGQVKLPGGVQPSSIRKAIMAGVAIIPADRAQRGLLMRSSIGDNVNLVSSGARRSAISALRPSELKKRAAERIASLSTVYASIDQPVWQLSGGNQQKVLFAKWLAAKAKVYVMNDPTCAVDIHAKAEVHALIRTLRDESRIVVLTSTDMDELAGLCDRVYVLRRGTVAAVLDGENISSRSLTESMSQVVATSQSL